MRRLLAPLCVFALLWGAPAQAQNINSSYAIGSLLSCTATGTALTTATPKTLCSVTIVSGDWDCQGFTWFVGIAGSTPGFLGLATSSTTNNMGSAYDSLSTVGQGAQQTTMIAHATQYQVPGAVYLVAQANFGAGSITANNSILNCRRWR